MRHKLLHILLFWITFLFFIGQSNAQVANFTANVTTGCPPLAVQFTDASTGSPTAWFWDFGNGLTSVARNPFTTYTNPGTFNVRLRVLYSNGDSAVELKTGYIVAKDVPNPQFSAFNNNGCFPLTTNFNDLSTSTQGAITNWNWNFGDGAVSNLQNPSHTYLVAGSFPVTLTVTNALGCTKELIKPAFVNVSPGVFANFNILGNIVCDMPAVVTLSSTSSGPGNLNYQWDFGDGSPFQNTTNTIHTYNNVGVYTATLLVTSSLGCSQSKSFTFLVDSFKAVNNIPTQVCAGTQNRFFCTTTPRPRNVRWNFGDGTSSISFNPNKTYANAGTYQVTMWNQLSTGCEDSVIKTITVVPKPAITFSANATESCKAPFTVNFTNTTAGVTVLGWNFGDGTSSTQPNPSHTYTQFGSYNVTLKVQNTNGCIDSLTQAAYIKISKLGLRLTNIPGEGCKPYNFSPLLTVAYPDPISSYFWDMGNGMTYNIVNPTTTYPNVGNFTITVRVTSQAGCTDTAVFANAVNVGTPPTNLNFTASPNPVCGSQKVRFIGTGRNYTKMTWDFGDNTVGIDSNILHQYRDTGLYTVKMIVSNNGCKDSIVRPAYLRVSGPISKFTFTTNCANRKQLTFTNQSILADSCRWFFGDGTNTNVVNPVHLFPAPGNYDMQLVCYYGPTCTDTLFRPITIASPQIDFSATPREICKGDRDTIYFTATGNIPNYNSVTWDYGNGSTGNTIPLAKALFPSAGLFTINLYATDISGCVDTVTKTNYIKVNGPSPDFNPSSNIFCSKQALTFNDLTTTYNGYPIVQWTWDWGDSTSQTFTAPPFRHIYQIDSIYDVRLIVKDAYGCVDSVLKESIVLTEAFNVRIFVPDTASCPLSNIQFAPVSQGNISTYYWDFGDGTIIPNNNSPMHAYADTGIYNVKVLASAANGCKDSAIQTMVVRRPRASFLLSDSLSSCQPVQINFSDRSYFTRFYFWDFDDGITSITPNPIHNFTAVGTYNVKLRVISPGGCVDSAIRVVKIFPQTGSFSYSPIVGCQAINVQFDGNFQTPARFRWDFGDGASSVTTDSFVSHNYTLVGSYLPKLVIEDLTGCLVNLIGPDTIRVEKVIPKFNGAPLFFCDSGTVRFIDSSTIVANVINYKWYFGDGDSSVATSPSHLYANPGIYNVSLLLTTPNGCRDSLSRPNYIKVKATPKIDILGDTSACVPASITYRGSWLNPDTSVVSWTWNFGNGQTSNVQNPTAVNFNTVGTYNIKLNATNNDGCTKNDSLQLIVHPLPLIMASADTTICFGQPAFLSATGGNTYDWNLNSYALNCVLCPNPTANPLTNSLYIVEGKSQFGCVNKDSILVKVLQRYTLTTASISDSICSGKSFRLQAFGAPNYLWSPDSSLSNSRVANPIARPTSTTTYKVVGSDSLNCFNDSINVVIKVNSNPTVSAGRDTTIQQTGTAFLNGTFSSDVVNYNWRPPYELTCTNCPSPTATPKQNTQYIFTVTNGGGCVSSDSVTVFVICNNDNVYIPNTFSPNGDGMNDVFFVRGKGVFSIKSMRIFNRVGQLVLEKREFLPNDISAGWDGRVFGQKPVGDTYVYVIEVVCENSYIIKLQGNISIIQ